MVDSVHNSDSDAPDEIPLSHVKNLPEIDDTESFNRPERQEGRSSVRQAVALSYNDAEELPRVIASGRGEVAEQLLRIARESRIPINNNRSLVEMLGSLPVGAAITPETFRLVAEIVVFLYHADLEWQKQHSFLTQTLENPVPSEPANLSTETAQSPEK